MLPRIAGLTPQAAPPRKIAEMLESTKWSDDLSAKEAETLARYLHPCTMEKGAFLVRQGAKDAYLALIVTGTMDIVKETPNGAPALLHTAGPGRTIGEMSIIDGEPRSASVVAAEPTTLLILSDDGFKRLVDEVPRLAVRVVMKIAKLTSQRLRLTSGQLVDHLGS